MTRNDVDGDLQDGYVPPDREQVTARLQYWAGQAVDSGSKDLEAVLVDAVQLLKDERDKAAGTVQVPIKDIAALKKAVAGGGWRSIEEAARAVIERFLAPKPRLVAFDIEAWRQGPWVSLQDYVDKQPDLFTTLDAVIDEWVPETNLNQVLKAHIRAAFGVTE